MLSIRYSYLEDILLEDASFSGTRFIPNFLSDLKHFDLRLKLVRLVCWNGKGKGKSHIRSVFWGVSATEDTCPGSSAL